MAYRRSSAGEEDQTTKVGSSLVGEGAGGIDESSNTIRLNCRAEQRATVRSTCTGGLLGLEKLLGCASSLGFAVGIAKDGGEHRERGGVSEDSAEGNCRRLDGRKV